MMFNENINILCCIAIVILIIYIWYCISTEYSFNEQFIFGSWESDSAFNEKSDIKEMRLFIGEIKGFINKYHDCYLHIDANDGNITSQIIKIKYKGYINSTKYFPSLGIKKYRVVLEFEEEETIIPSDLIMEIDKLNGLIKLYDDEDNLYGVLYKDNSSSHLIKLEQKSEDEDNEVDEKV